MCENTVRYVSFEEVGMKRDIYLFNPGHDLALANGSPYYYPSQQVRQMEGDLSLLPLWYAEKGGVVVTEEVNAEMFIAEMSRLLPSFAQQSLSAVPPNGLAALMKAQSDEEWRLSPWGWDEAVRTSFRKMGVAETLLPDDDAMTSYRRLSNRQRAVELLSTLRPVDAHLTGESSYLTDLSSCVDFASRHGDCVFKAPWSGSGKGLNWKSGNVFSSPFERWCRRQLEMQGGVVAEVMVRKLYDLAAEFFVDDEGKVSFAGFSSFQTSQSGVYDSNMLVPQNYIDGTPALQLISSKLIPTLQQLLSTMFSSSYRGYLGVDMMVCRGNEEGEVLVHPCVEVNARTTMGVVARLFYDRYVSPHAIGTMHTSYYKSVGEALRFHREMLQSHPLVVVDGRLASGYLSLTPVNDKTRCNVWAEIRKGS